MICSQIGLQLSAVKSCNLMDAGELGEYQSACPHYAPRVARIRPVLAEYCRKPFTEKQLLRFVAKLRFVASVGGWHLHQTMQRIERKG
jgi:hypothetical protein